MPTINRMEGRYSNISSINTSSSMGSTLLSWRFQKSIHPPVLRRLPCLWTHEWRVFWVSTRPMRWIFHAKHGKARDVQPTILDVHERTGSSIRKSENVSAIISLLLNFINRLRMCKKVKALFSAHIGVNRILDGAINSSNLQSLTIDH